MLFLWLLWKKKYKYCILKCVLFHNNSKPLYIIYEYISCFSRCCSAPVRCDSTHSKARADQGIEESDPRHLTPELEQCSEAAQRRLLDERTWRKRLNVRHGDEITETFTVLWWNVIGGLIKISKTVLLAMPWYDRLGVGSFWRIYQNCWHRTQLWILHLWCDAGWRMSWT